MALKKSELYFSLWSSCDELRGGMDASQYKDYVLVLLFIKYVSDKYAGQVAQYLYENQETRAFRRGRSEMSRMIFLLEERSMKTLLEGLLPRLIVAGHDQSHHQPGRPAAL
ncbi:MAG: type I restriction-modification system subunit M N-terminal domain-containing protein [Desulfobacterales bacterium]